MKQFKDRVEKRKEMRHEQGIHRRSQDCVEVACANHLHGEGTKIIFVNIGLGKQRTAKNFWVSLPKPLPIQRIRNRVETAFGDLV